MLRLVGKKIGMMTLFDSEKAVPVTVIHVEPNVITQIKTLELDGYASLQIAYGSEIKKADKVGKPLLGHYAKAGVSPREGLFELRLDSDFELSDKHVPGSKVTVSIFKAGDKVDVSGITKGKGYAGAVKRHNFSMQRATHGNSLSHRAPGSIGQNQTPGRVFKGKKMAGQLGDKQRTLQNLEVFRIDEEKNLVLIKGSVPGSASRYVTIKPAVKQSKVREAKS